VTQNKCFAAILAANKNKPTIVFLLPIAGTLDNYNKNANTDDYVSQPREEIRMIMADKPQV
jgi:hypothetical protein